MIELGRHIEILLLTNDCVIVPGLGGFMAHHVEARFDSRDNMFLPPYRTLGFNPKLSLNDSLLVQSYVEAYDISYPDALQRIENEVCEIKQHISINGSYILSNIGELSMNCDGNYVFEPCMSGVLTPAFYGLSSFEAIPSLIDKELANETISTINDNIFEQPSNTNEDVTEEIDNNVIKIKVAWIRNTVAVAAAIISFFLITTPISNNTDNVILSDISSIITLTSHDKVDNTPKLNIDNTSLTKKDVIVKKDTVDTLSKTVSIKQEKINKVEDKEPAFRIILASYITQKNAKEFVNKLHKQGYDKAYIYVKNNVVRVAYGAYPTENDAYNDLRLIHKNKQLSKSWVYKR
jgi:cell division septation protein DedD